ncbi:hypothetical protein OG301_39295 (plasmid) [Streptomyces platensis]|uniref:hypothetical protein n=1 Tax=Streptomyces platensis TaxID=58346 RepID=UPI002ED14EE2|nr:hypothetical protein OG301_39295 [Streptomyces platensis]
MIERRMVTNALAALLSAATSLPVGRGVLPASPANATAYYVLTSLDSTLSGAPYADMNEDLSLVIQVTSVSAPDKTRPGSAGSLEQAEGLADKARTAFLARNPTTGQWTNPLAVSGVRCMCRELETEPGAMNDPADGIISYVQRFRFDLTPA